MEEIRDKNSLYFTLLYLIKVNTTIILLTLLHGRFSRKVTSKCYQPGAAIPAFGTFGNWLKTIQRFYSYLVSEIGYTEQFCEPSMGVLGRIYIYESSVSFKFWIGDNMYGPDLKFIVENYEISTISMHFLLPVKLAFNKSKM